MLYTLIIRYPREFYGHSSQSRTGNFAFMAPEMLKNPSYRNSACPFDAEHQSLMMAANGSNQ